MILRYNFLKVLILLLAGVLPQWAMSQNEGDYRTILTGTADWSDLSLWETYTSGSWHMATSYPGELTGTGDVQINADVNITLDLSPPNAIQSLTFSDGSITATDITMGLNALTVTGDVLFGIPAADEGDQNIFVNSGSLTCGSVTMVNTGDNSFDTRIDIETGTLIVNGDVTMANSNRNNIYFANSSCTGEVYIYGDFNGNGFTRGGSTVYYTDAAEQIVGNCSYYNLVLSGGEKTLRNSTNIYGTLTLGAVLDIANRQLYFSNAATWIPDTSYGTSAMINISNDGYIRRDGNETSDYEMVYPVGIGSDYTPMEITSIAGSDVNGYIYIRLFHEKSALTSGSDNALTRYWDIRSTNTTFTSVSGSFTYSDNDVLSPVVESNLTSVGHYDGSDWLTNESTTAYDHANNRITFSNVSSITGEWTLGENSGCFDGLPTGKYTVRDGSWTTATTWNDGVAPLNDGTEDITVFHSLGSLNTAIDVNSLTIKENGYINFYTRAISIVSDLTVEGVLLDNNSTGTITIGNDLVIKSGGSYNIQRGTLTVTGQTSVKDGGTLSDTDGNGSCIFNGLLTVDNGGNFTSNVDDFTFNTGLENNGTFINSSSYNLLSDLTISGISEVQFTNDLYVGDNITLTNENTGGVTITDVFDGQGDNATVINKGLINYYRTYRVPMLTGVLDCSSYENTFNYYRDGRQYIKATTYYNLICSSNNDKELQGTTTVLNNLTTSETADFECLGNDLIITGSVTHGSSGEFTTGSNTVTYNGNGDQSILDITYEGGLVLDGSGTKSLQNTTTVNGVITVQGTSVFDLNSQQLTADANITINNGATMAVDENSTLQLADGVTLDNNGVFKAVGTEGNGALVTTSGSGGYLIDQSDASSEFHALYATFDYTGGISITDGTVDTTNNFSYSTFSNGTGTDYLNVTDLDPVGGMTSITGAVFGVGPSYNVTRTSGTDTITFVQASGDLSGENYDQDNNNPGTLIEWTDPTAIYYSTGDVSAYAAASWAHNPDGSGGNPTLAQLTDGTLTLIVQDGHTVTLDSNGDIDVRKLIVGEGTSGTFNIGSDATQQTVTVQELLQVNEGAVLQPGSAGTPAHILKLYGNLVDNGTINLRQSYTLVVSTEIYGEMNISGTSTPVFSQLTFKSGCDATAEVALDINWNLILESGAVFNDGGLAHTVEFNWTNNGGTYNATGSLTFDGGTSSITATGTTTTFNDVNFTGGGVTTIKEDVVMNGDVTIDNNTKVSVDDVGIVVNGDYTLASGSEYEQTSNSISFEGTDAQLITLEGTSSFYRVYFSNGDTNAKTIVGDITVDSRFYINSGATVDGSGNVYITGIFRVNGTCDLSGTITTTGSTSYIECSDAAVSAFTLGTADLVIETTTYIRHTVSGESVTVTADKDVSVTESGALYIGANAFLNGQATATLLLDAGRGLHILGSDNFPSGFGSYDFDETAIVYYDGSMDQVVRGGFIYGRLYLRYGYTKTVDGIVDITGQLYLYDGVTFDLQNYTHTFSGSYIYNSSSHNGSIDGSNATFIIGDADYNQTIQASGTGSYTFKDLILRQNGATATRTQTFSSGCNITILNDLSITNVGGTEAIQHIVDLSDNAITGSANSLSLAAYCQLNVDHVNFGEDVIDDFSASSFDVKSTVYYSLSGDQYIADGVTYGNLELNAGNKTAEGALDIDGSLGSSSSSLVFYDGGFTHTIAGDWELSSTNYYTDASATGTIVFDGVDQDINGYNFNNITIANTGTANLFHTLYIYGDLTVNDGSSFDATTLSMYVGGDLSVLGTGVYRQTTGTTILDGDGAQNITLTANSSFGNLTVDKEDSPSATVSALSNVSVAGDVVISSVAGVLDISNDTLSIGDDFTVGYNTGVQNLITTGSTIIFGGSSAQSFTTLHEDNLVLNNLVFKGSGDKTLYYSNASAEILASQSFEVNGDVTIDNVALNGYTINLYVRGDWNNSGTFTHSRTVYFDGADQSISSSDFRMVYFEGSDTKTLTGNITVTYDVYIEGTTTLNADGNDITLGRSWYNQEEDAGYTPGVGKVIFNGLNDAYVYSGTTSGSVTGKNFYDFYVNKTGNRVRLGGDLYIENDLVVNTQQLRTDTCDIWVGGDFDIQDTYYCNNDNSLLTLNASGGSHIFNPNGATIRGIVIDAPGADYEMQSDLVLNNGDMTINAGTLDVNGNEITLTDSGRKIDIDGGTLNISASSTIQFSNTQYINLNSGSLYIVGEEGQTANLLNSSSSNAFTVNAIAGTLFADYYRVQKGSIVITGAILDEIDNLSNGTFIEGDAGTSYITLTGVDLGDGIELSNMMFNSGADYNIERTSGTGTVTVMDATGSMTGEYYDLDDGDDGDPGTLVDWTFPDGFFWDGNGSAANSNWHDALNWLGNTVPGEDDIIYLDHSELNDAYSVVISSEDAYCQRVNMDIEGGNAIGLTVGSGDTLFVTENVNISAGATLSQTDNTAIIKVGTNWTNQGTYNANGSSVIFSAASGDYIISTGGTGTGKDFYDLELNAGIATYTLDNPMHVENDLTITQGTLDLASSGNSLSIGGDWYMNTSNGAAFDSNTADVTFNGTAQSITNGTFYNLLIDSTSVTSLHSNIAVNNDLILNEGSTLDAQDYNMYVRGDWQNDNGAFSQSGLGTVILDGTSTQYLDKGTNSTTFNNITFTESGTKYIQKDITVTGNLLINSNSGVVNLGTYQLTGDGEDNSLVNNRYLQIEGEDNFPSGFETIEQSTSSRVYYFADIDQNIYPTTYGNIYLRRLTNGTDLSVKTALGDIYVTGSLYLDNANRPSELDMATNDVDLILTGSISLVPDNVIDWGSGNATCRHIGPSWYMDADITSFNHLVLAGTGDKYTRGDFTMTGNLTIKSGVDLYMYGSDGRNDFKTITGSGSDTLSMETGARIFNSRPATDGPAIPEGFASYDLDENSTYYLYSNGVDQTLYTGSGIVYGNLIFSSEKNVTGDGIADLNVDGNWDVNTATYYDGGTDMNVAGASIYFNNYVASSVDRVLTLDGLRDQILYDDQDNVLDFAALQFSGTGTKTIKDPSTVEGNWTIDEGVIVKTAYDITFNGSDWDNSGYYQQTSNSLIFNASSDQIIDPGTFDDANYFSTIEFNGASTKTFVNDLNVNNDIIINEGVVDFGSNACYLYDDLTNTNGATLTASNTDFILDGAGQNINTPDFTVHSVTCRGSNYKYLYCDWNIAEDLTIEAGATLQTRTNSMDYDIYIGGDWTNEGSFIDNTGTVTFNGSTSPVRITSGGSNFYDVNFIPGSAVSYSLESEETSITDVMNVDTNATLELNGQTLVLGRDNTTAVTHTIQGTLNVNGGAVLDVNNDDEQSTLDVYGTLEIVGERTTNVATLTSSTTSTNRNKTLVNINPGATMAARYYLIEYIADEGLNLIEGSTLDATNNFSDGTFLGMRDRTDVRYITLESDYAGDTIANISFNFSDIPTEGEQFNVQRKNGSPDIIFTDVTGSIGNYKYEDDDQSVAYDNGKLRWPEITESNWTGALDTDWFKDGNWDNGVPTSTIDAIIGDQDNDPFIYSAGAVCKDLNITDGTLRIEDDMDMDVKGSVLVDEGVLYVNSSESVLSVGGDWTVNQYGNFSHGDATVEFISSNGSVNIDPGNSSFYNIVFNNTLTTFNISSSSLDVEGDLTIYNGTLRPAVTNYTYNLYGDYKITNGDFDEDAVSNGTILLLREGDQTVTNGEFNNIEVSGSGNKDFSGDNHIYGTTDVYSSMVAETASSIVFEDDVTIDPAGTFNDGGESHDFQGTNWYGYGTYAGEGTVTFNRTSGNQNIYEATFHNLVIDCEGRVLYLQDDINVNGDFTVKNGINYVNLLTHTITNDGSGVCTFEDEVPVYVYGENNFPKGFASYDLAASSITRYWGSSSQYVDGVSYGNLYFYYQNTKTLTGDVEVKGDINLYTATLDVSENNYSLTVGGYWYNTNADGGDFVCREGEVIFSNTSNNVIYIGDDNTNTFYDLTVSGSARVSAGNSTNNDFVVTNNLTVTGGEFNAYGRIIYVGGDLIADGSGTFYTSGTYYLNKSVGTASIRANESVFNNITIESGAVYTVQDDVSLNGSFNLLSGTFDGNGNEIDLGNSYTDVVNIEGTYIVGAGGILGLGSGTSCTVSINGRLEVVGSETGLAKVTNNSSGGRYTFVVNGEIAAGYYLFEYMSGEGIYLTSTSTIDETNHFSNGTFSNGATTGQLFRIENTQTFNEANGNRMENISFPINPGGSSFNVAKYSASSGDIEIYNSTGVFAGENYDNDPSDLITWTGPVSLTWNGSVDTDWNEAGNWTASSGSSIVPTADNDVLIPGGLVNYPILTLAGQVCGNLTMDLGGEIRIKTSSGDAAVDLNVDGDFDISGSLATYSLEDSITVEGNWLVSSGSTVQLKGNVTFDGVGGSKQIDNSTASFYSLTISGTTEYQISEDTEIEEGLVIEPGASFDANPADYSITIGGNWINEGTFNAHEGTVIFSSSDDQEIYAGTSAFYDVQVDASGATYNLTSDMLVNENLALSDGTLDVQTNTLQVGDGDGTEELSVSGVLLINGGATLDMGDGASLNVNSGGYIELLGTDDANRATLTSSTAGRYSFDVNSGGSIKASYYSVDYTDADGLFMHSGADIDDTYDLSNGVFSNGYPGTGSYMTLLHEMGVAQDTLRNLVFNAGPAYSVTRTSGTTVFYFEDASGEIGNYLYEKDDEITPSPSSGLLQWPFENLYTWEGDVDSDWNNAENWFGDQVPVATADVTIPNVGFSPVIDGSDVFEVRDLDIATDATVTINAGNLVIINGDLTTSDGLVIDNTLDNPVSIMLYGTVTGEATINWNDLPVSYYKHMGHYASGVTLSEYDNSVSGGYYLYYYQKDAWVQASGSLTTEPMRGYVFYNKQDGDQLSYAGVLNTNASYSFSAAEKGWYSLANPYPAYIDVASDDFDLGTFDSNVYVRTFNENKVITCYLSDKENPVVVNGSTTIIAPAQGYYLRNTTTNSTVTVGSDARVMSDEVTSIGMKSVTIGEEDILRLELSNSSSIDETVVILNSNGSASANSYDAVKYANSGSNVNFYSVKDSKNLVVNVMPEDIAEESVVLACSVSDMEDSYTIQATNIEDFRSSMDVFLLDKYTNETINLRETGSYTFSLTEEAVADRFELIFVQSYENNGVTEIQETESQEKVDIYAVQQVAHVVVNDQVLKKSTREIIVYDVQGKVINRLEIRDLETEIDLPASGKLYIIKVVVNDKVYVSKVIAL